ncbi:MAG: branched-chain amino acid ABC transporter permease, partial [Betaproteobacteria bacterium]|nr:branched-chain amino acid ABC transporter permease [Betaproteobacteria bacterium]
MDIAALIDCLTSASCLVTQASTGLIVGALLFLVAAGLTLIFGVLGVINFAHGSFYMLGAYVALSVYRLSGSFVLAVVAAGFGVGLFGLLLERLFMRRVYNADVLMQLLVCYAFILILDDVVKIVWGPNFQSMGMPEAFQAPPLLIGGGVVPVFYVYLIAAAGLIALVLWAILTKTRIGKIVR